MPCCEEPTELLNTVGLTYDVCDSVVPIYDCIFKKLAEPEKSATGGDGEKGLTLQQVQQWFDIKT